MPKVDLDEVDEVETEEVDSEVDDTEDEEEDEDEVDDTEDEAEEDAETEDSEDAEDEDAEASVAEPVRRRGRPKKTEATAKASKKAAKASKAVKKAPKTPKKPKAVKKAAKALAGEDEPNPKNIATAVTAFCECLAKAMEAKGMSTKDLAEKMEISESRAWQITDAKSRNRQGLAHSLKTMVQALDAVGHKLTIDCEAK